ncbi:MAG: MATE family efflux transporter [Campylobacterales bacterium]|nr:MATE family efflux transporter [Campylobacterales bacterium]
MKPQTNHKKILAIALPAAVNSLLSMLQVIVDLLMVGKISIYAIAAVGLGIQIVSFFYGFLTLFHIGTTAIISRLVGGGSIKKASLVVSSTLRFGIFASVPLVAVWIFLAPQIYLWFGIAQEALHLGNDYITVLTMMLPFVMINTIFVASLNAYGDSKTPLYVQIFSIVANIILNTLFIFGYGIIPAMGVAGAALATVIVNVASTLIYTGLYLCRFTPYLPMWRYSKKLVKQVITIGVPASIEKTLTMASYMVFSYTIASHGTYAFGGYQLGVRIEGIAFTLGLGFTIATMTLVGQSLGAKNPLQAKYDALSVLRYAVGLMGVLSIFMIWIPHELVGLFTDDTQTVTQASIYLMIVGLSQIPLAFELVLGGALRGAGDTRTTLKINLLSLWFVRIVPALVLSDWYHDIVFVYYAMIADTLVRAIVLWIVFKQGKWQNIKV